MQERNRKLMLLYYSNIADVWKK